ncbi:MAG: type II toxin-antitoxin system HipA family toxin [Planctomycetaceae bacterium]|nr:type II toxin-antitoxin system HipA family toxin [Planctomycetaceae bacterium]
MSDVLFVHYESATIGELSVPSSSGLMQFRYRETWSGSDAAFPISLSLPLAGNFDPTASHHFFVNLLPEANVRQQICNSLRISPSNDFELLKAIGGDCAGALAITADPQPPAIGQHYEPITEDQLAAWSVGTPDAFSTVTGQNEVRLSLAGAQDKLPVHLHQDQLFIPCGNTPSTSLLKFASPYYSHLPENETFITMLAAAAGLPTVEIRLRKTQCASIAVIARYDRILQDKHYRRLHQEDFCQALGIGPSHKYEKEGGPSLKQCAEVIRRHTSFPLMELQKLLQWVLFNLLVGNADAHGKNLSLLYVDGRHLQLAPFYDLVCTRNYRNISRHLAMSLGGVFDPDLITDKQLAAVATDLGIRPLVVQRAAKQLGEKILQQIPAVSEQFASLYGDSPILERIPIVIRKQIRRVTQSSPQAD